MILLLDVYKRQALGNDYLVAPDVVIYRDLYEDSEINAAQCIVDGDVSKMADIRKANGGKPLLHASVSAKYLSLIHI